jgi:hypothetical protein
MVVYGLMYPFTMGIEIEWGGADTGSFNEKDSVFLYRRNAGSSYVRHSSGSARETYLNDWQWKKIGFFENI